MISDSPYKVNEIPLPAWGGILAGLIGAVLMLVVMGALEPVTGISLNTILTPYATMLLPHRFEQVRPDTLVLIGLTVHLVLRALLGLLYSVSQQLVPLRGFIAVGIFFGFLLWILGGIVGRILSGGNVRSWGWLLANLVFGLSLATAAVIASKVRPWSATAVPRD